MPHMTERKCRCCKRSFMARTADVKRGWALFCSKSCKATHQEARTGQYSARLRRDREERDPRDVFHPFSSEALGQD